jgi:hypothetical protein
MYPTAAKSVPEACSDGSVSISTKSYIAIDPAASFLKTLQRKRSGGRLRPYPIKGMALYGSSMAGSQA